MEITRYLINHLIRYSIRTIVRCMEKRKEQENATLAVVKALERASLYKPVTGIIESEVEKKMTTKLFPYQYVPAGLEIVIDLGSGVEHGHQGEIVPGSKGGIWNLWWNVTLSDNPETWDDKVKAINNMQTMLGDLPENHRLIRAHIAEFCRFHPFYPQSIDILCEEIGTGRFTRPVRLGCEGRGLLETLGKEDSQTLDDQRKESLTGHLQALTKWLKQSPRENAIDYKVSGFLGQPTDSKISFVEKLVATINPEEPSVVTIRELCHEQCIKTYGETVVNTHGRPFNCFRCDQSGHELPNCQCFHVMLLNSAIICTGTLGEERQLFEQYGFVQENILAYATAINSWLSGTSMEYAKLPFDRKYVTRDSAFQITQGVHESLGKKDEVKEWLAACLLKTLKDNQRWFKTIELIDNYPQATSWFTKLSGGQ